MSTVLTADNSALFSQIGSKVCQAIIAIQVQQPELLLDKYKDIPWQSSRHQSNLVNKLIEVLGQAKDEKLIQQILQKFLRVLLAPESFSSPILANLFKEVAQLSSNGSSKGSSEVVNNQPPAPPPLNVSPASGSTGSTENNDKSEPVPESVPENTVKNESSEVAPIENINSDALPDNKESNEELNEKSSIEEVVSETLAETNSSAENAQNVAHASGGVAVLLLDAENLQFNHETEKFLSSVCNYPIYVKVAFANWCRKGKLDAELHARNYDLIHVPSGKDNADGKMITFGASINQRFPNAKEVFVCSSDNVMTNLCNQMIQNGLNVYRVVKQGSNLTVLDIQSGTTHVHTVLPTIEQFVNQIKDIIRDEESRTGNQWIKLSKLSKIFHNKYNIGVNQVVSHHFQGKTAKDIFVEHAEFAVHHLSEDAETFITVFKLPHVNK